MPEPTNKRRAGGPITAAVVARLILDTQQLAEDMGLDAECNFRLWAEQVKVNTADILDETAGEGSCTGC